MSERLLNSDDIEYWWARKEAEPFIIQFMQRDATIKITEKELFDLLVTMFYIGKED